MKLTLLITIIIVLAGINAYKYLPPEDGGLHAAAAAPLYQIPLIEPLELQRHTNAILIAHGEEPIAEDGIMGPETSKAYNLACALQAGYFVTKEYME